MPLRNASKFSRARKPPRSSSTCCNFAFIQGADFFADDPAFLFSAKLHASASLRSSSAGQSIGGPHPLCYDRKLQRALSSAG
jgi:hypothetical protein